MVGIPIGECIVANFWFGKRKAFLLAGSIYAGAVCIAIPACCAATCVGVWFTQTFVREMITGNAGGDDARTVLADACRGIVCRIAVQTLRAAVIILVDAGIMIKAFVARAGADDALAILA